MTALAAASALVSASAVAQAQQTVECDRLVQHVERHAGSAGMMTLESAKALQAKRNEAECRQALVRVQADAGAAGQTQEDGANIVVQQPAPTVTVDQVAPKVTVQQPQPQVTVSQGQPEIVVNQPAPTVVIDIPQPEIIVRMPEPDVNVSQAQPEVTVQQPQPTVRVVQAEQPQVQVEQGTEAQVSVAQPQESAQVQLEQSGQPKITYNRAEPKVTINQAEGQPQIRVERMNRQAADGQSTAGEVTGSTSNPDAGDAMQTGAMRSVTASDVAGMEVVNDRGEAVGRAQGLVKSGQDGKLYVIIDQNGFMGLNDKRVALTVEGLVLRDGKIVVAGVGDAEIKAFPAFQPSAQFPVAPGNTTAEFRTAG